MKSTPSLKPLLTIALLFFIQYTSFGQQSKNEFLLHGTIEGLKEGIIYLNYYLNKEGKNVKDSSSIHNGRFFFEGKLSEPMVASIRLNRTNEINDNSSYVFFRASHNAPKLTT